MGLFTLNPTGAPVTPDPAQGGNAVTGAVTDGHGSTSISVQNGASQSKTCIWSGFPSSSGQILSIALKVDWSENGSLPTGANSFTLEYSINNGSSWAALFAHSDVIAPNSGTAAASLAVDQDLTQVKVRDKLFCLASGAADINTVTGAISGIRIEVTTVDAQVIMMM